MAKETKAQRQAREYAEKFAEWALFSAEYPTRFAALMYEMVSNPEFSVIKLDAETYEFRYDYESVVLKTTAPANPVWEVQYDMERVEGFLRYANAEKEEAQRRANVRTAALAKLNSEERTLLGL
jgi:hypothetical protein